MPRLKYYCPKCKHNHYYDSKIGKQHRGKILFTDKHCSECGTYTNTLNEDGLCYMCAQFNKSYKEAIDDYKQWLDKKYKSEAFKDKSMKAWKEGGWKGSMIKGYDISKDSTFKKEEF